ncbi:MAG TPA: hypothetical protein VFD56_13385, partial [Chitinophagaceae bacterium]|nr:hypothetical protein [Chitinophagaceae bacterium]
MDLPSGITARVVSFTQEKNIGKIEAKNREIFKAIVNLFKHLKLGLRSSFFQPPETGQLHFSRAFLVDWPQ